MKKNILLISLLAIATALVLYFYSNKKDRTIDSEETKFAIENIESIDRIFIADTDGKRIDLKKKGDEWIVNDEAVARKTAVDLILKVFKDIKIQSEIEKSTLKTNLKRLAAVHRKVEIYQGDDEPVKVWYIGEPSDSNFGTKMLLEIDGKKSEKIYITDLPWHHGFITPMFFTDLVEWKDTKIFSYDIDKIKSVSLKNFTNENESFSVEVANGSFLVKDSKNQILPSLDSIMVKDYLKEMRYKSYESVDTSLTAFQKDSIIKSTPLYSFKLIDTGGKQIDIKIFKKRQTRKAVDEIGNELVVQPEFDQQRSYALINKKDLVLIQMQSFGKLLVDKTIFTK